MVVLDSLPFEKGRLRGIYLCDPYRRGRFFLNRASFSPVYFRKIDPISFIINRGVGTPQTACLPDCLKSLPFISLKADRKVEQMLKLTQKENYAS
jgi:hypothetical protein